MPFRTVPETAITISQPHLIVHDQVYEPNEPVQAWDYLTNCHALVEFEVDQSAVLNATGLSSMGPIAAAAQVDCHKTGFRQLASTPLNQDSVGSLRIEIPAHSIAHDIEIRCGLILVEDVPQSATTAGVAHRKGSRLFWQESRARFELEGQGGGFPVEAFDFASARLPSEAAWRLHFDADNLDRPYLAAVRLLVNSAHPRAPEILAGREGSLFHSIVFHGVFEQMLLAVADGAPYFGAEFEEGSTGAVLDDLTRLFVGKSLPDTVAALRNNRMTMLTRLQSNTAFLHGRN